MDHQRPDPDSWSRVEDGGIRRLRPRTVTSQRLPAALPIAIAAIMVVTSVALGAAVMQNVVSNEVISSATPVVGGDEPTPTPTETPTATPTATEVPPPVSLDLTVTVSPGQAILTWSAYGGADFGSYQVVRSADGLASWPLDSDDTLLAAISAPGTLTYTDLSTGTFTYRVFALDSGGDVVGVSLAISITVPSPTPAPTRTPEPTANPTPNPTPTATANPTPNPTPAPGLVLSVSGTDNGNGWYTIHLTWTKYTGTHFQWYGIQKTGPTTPPALPNDPALPPSGQTPWQYFGSVNTTSFDWTVAMKANQQTYKFKLWAYTEELLSNVDGGVVPACYVGTVLAESNVVTITVPAKTPPTPTPTPTPTSTPS